MKRFLLLIAIVSALLISGCTVSKGNQKIFDDVYANRVVIGDSIETAISLFGAFASKSDLKGKKGKDSSTIYTWVSSTSKSNAFGKSSGKSKMISITVINGKITDINKSDTNF